MAQRRASVSGSGRSGAGTTGADSPFRLAQAVAGVGLTAVISPADGADDRGGAEEDPTDAPAIDAARAWLGASLRDKSGALEVTAVVEGGPSQQAGVCVGDEVCALDGFRAELKVRLDIRDLPGEERGRYNTVAGLLLAVSGHLPQTGERIDCGDWLFEVVDLDGRRIDKVLARHQPRQRTEPAAAMSQA